MKKSDFYYDLPEALIAQTPVEPRDASRMLVYDRREKKVQHKVFADMLQYLNPGDVLVLNETRVIPARLNGHKQNGTAKAEVLLLRALSDTDWDALIRPGKRLPVGTFIEFGPDFVCEVKEKKQEGVAVVSFKCTGDFHTLVEKYGKAPLPPYIHDESPDKERYQTVYAKTNGSAAAPTAGLHFTPELLGSAKEKGVQVVPILLHVGLGTFRPVKEDEITDHTMHSEYYEVSESAAGTINAAKAKGKRIFAVGTTSVRTLESVADENGMVRAGRGETDIFIYPGYTFKCIDAIITNFHLPESTLLMLVSAFIGREQALGLYKTAVEEKYRFFSYGDAMLLL